jgi:hypothetical protein
MVLGHDETCGIWHGYDCSCRAPAPQPAQVRYGVYFRPSRRAKWQCLGTVPDRQGAERLCMALMAKSKDNGDWLVTSTETAP